MSRFPAVFRPPAFASRSSDSRQGIEPSLRSADRTRTSGPRRGYRVPHARATTGVGASYTPRTAMLPRPAPLLRPAPAASQRPVPTPRYNIPSSGASDNEASTEVHAIHPSGHSPRLWPPDGTGALGLLPRASNPADQEPTTHVRVGTGLEHKPGTTLTTSAEPPIRASTRNVRPRVAPKACDYADKLGDSRSKNPSTRRMITAKLTRASG